MPNKAETSEKRIRSFYGQNSTAQSHKYRLFFFLVASPLLRKSVRKESKLVQTKKRYISFHYRPFVWINFDFSWLNNSRLFFCLPMAFQNLLFYHRSPSAFFSISSFYRNLLFYCITNKPRKRSFLSYMLFIFLTPHISFSFCIVSTSWQGYHLPSTSSTFADIFFI